MDFRTSRKNRVETSLPVCNHSVWGVSKLNAETKQG